MFTNRIIHVFGNLLHMFSLYPRFHEMSQIPIVRWKYSHSRTWTLTAMQIIVDITIRNYQWHPSSSSRRGPSWYIFVDGSICFWTKFQSAIYWWCLVDDKLLQDDGLVADRWQGIILTNGDPVPHTDTSYRNVKQHKNYSEIFVTHATAPCIYTTTEGEENVQYHGVVPCVK